MLSAWYSLQASTACVWRNTPAFAANSASLAELPASSAAIAARTARC